ncbi:MAG: cysteine hydrolase [Deltaproteobacteria bacterium]|nr:cysteine hydrolase [Deltaproteobacteria bacterium]
MVKRSEAYVTAGTLERRAGRWLADVRRNVAPRPWLRLDPSRCALLVVDMLRYFADPRGRCFLPAAAVITPRVAALVAAWRGLGAPVVFTRHCHAGAHDLGMLGRFFSDHIRLGEPDSEIVGDLRPQRGERIVRKTTYDAFWGTRLGSILRASGAKQVLVTGVLTHMCCDTTARAAFCRGFEVYLAVDATASSSEALHTGAILGLSDGVAVPMGTREILELCSAKE